MKFEQKIKTAIKKIALPPLIAEISAHLLHPIEQFAVWRDYWRTRRSTHFLRAHPFSSNAHKTVLLALASGMMFETKLHALLGVGLALKGYRVTVLLSRYYFWALRYFRLFGINDFIFWEDAVLSASEKEECRTSAEKFCTMEMSFKSIKKWKYRGALIGPQVISTVCRSEMQGAPNLNDPQIQRQIKELLPETLAVVHRADHLLDDVAPELLVVNESNYAKMGALVDTAIRKKVSVIQFVQPSRDDALFFKRLTPQTRRYHPASVDVSTMKQFEKISLTESENAEVDEELRNRYEGKWFLQSRNQPGVKMKNREDIITQLKLDPSKKIAIVFSHILWDANLFYGEDLFEDYGDWFVQTVKAACANPSVNWIIKLHPANLWKRAREGVIGEFSEVALIKKHVGELPDHVKLLYPNTDISTWSLFQIADYGITVRGTIGMELTCFGVPVFTAGTGRYSDLGFTVDSNTKEEYLRKLASLHGHGCMTAEQTARARKHAYLVFRLRPWVIKSARMEFHYKKKGVHPLDSNIYLTVSSFEELHKNGDLEKWAEWAQDLHSIDYLAQAQLHEKHAA